MALLDRASSRYGWPVGAVPRALVRTAKQLPTIASETDRRRQLT